MNQAQAPIAYNVADATIRSLSEQFLLLHTNGPEDRSALALVRESRLQVKALRVTIEKRRKELKVEALEYCRRVDEEAKRLFGMLEPIESHLIAEEQKVAEELARREKELLDKRMAALTELGIFSMLSPETVKNMSDAEFVAVLERQTALAEERRLEAELNAAKQEADRQARVEEQRKIEAERAAFEAEREAAKQEADRLRALVEAEVAKRRAELAKEEEALRARVAAEQAAAAQAKAERDAAEREAASIREEEERRKSAQADTEAKAEATKKACTLADVAFLRRLALHMRKLQIDVLSAIEVDDLASAIEAGEDLL